MCQDCGCGLEQDQKSDVQENTIVVNQSVTALNDAIAHQLWHHLKEKNIFCINIMGSPGSGKTTIIESLSKHLSHDTLFVIQGDLESDIDAKRLEAQGISSYQINTHSGCHLNASMINKALLECSLNNKSILFIENVGNLVCPAGVKIGQHMDVLVSSTAEGSDKPLKYPHIFKAAQLLVLSKYDAKDVLGFDEVSFTTSLSSIKPKLPVIKTSRGDEESFRALAKHILHVKDHFFEKSHHH